MFSIRPKAYSCVTAYYIKLIKESNLSEKEKRAYIKENIRVSKMRVEVNKK